MNSLDHYAEPFSPTGNLASIGALNQLGRPNMDRLQVMVREAVQNCWDAGLRDGQVRVGIASHSLSGDQFSLLRDRIFADTPGCDSISESFEKAASARLLVIYDRGTSGMGGPLRADTIGGEEPRDFVDFFRNIGQPPDKRFGGGTFGYGKAALYLASRIRTILVHTHCLHTRRPEARLMGAALTGQFREGDRNYTGRHWWGRLAGDGVIDPALGKEADEMAALLGFPGFNPDERGTSVGILQPDFGGRTPPEAMRYVVHSLLWNFWPKMVSTGLEPPGIRFEVSLDGHTVDVPDPDEFPPVAGLAEAYRLLRSGEEDGGPFGAVSELRCKNPIQKLGRVALLKFPAKQRPMNDLGPDGQIIPEPCHHVALLRVPELVVRYVEGPSLPSDLLEYGGVFLAERELDRVYARSEPPAHDDWVPKALENPMERRFVNVTYTRINEAVDAFIQPRGAGDGPQPEGAAPLGGFGEHLSGLLPLHTGPSARVSGVTSNGGDRRGGSTGRRVARVRIVEDPVLEVDENGNRLVTVAFEVAHARGSGGTRVQGKPVVVLESGEAETDPPQGSATARIRRWQLDGQDDIVDADEVLIPVSAKGTGRVIVSMPTDAAIEVRLTASADSD